MLIIRRHVGKCIGCVHIAGAAKSWDVRRLTFNGFASVVSSEVVDPRILVVSAGSGSF